MVKFHVRLSIVIGLCYTFTLCLIYLCIPIEPLSSKVDSKLQHYHANRTKVKDISDPYKLNWKDEDKVYFKKVRKLVDETQADEASRRKLINCEENSPSKFVRVCAGVYIYAAHLDNRNGTLHVRMIAAVTKTITKERLDTTLSCVFLFNEKGNKTSKIYSHIKSYEMCENHKRSYGGWILSCQIPDNLHLMPRKINIHFSDAIDNNGKTSEEICITSRDENISRRKLPFGMCIPPVYGQIKAKTLIEFIEFNKILGVNIFMLYIENSLESLSTEVRQILRYYEQQNIIAWYPWQLPFPVDSIWYHGQSLAITDCLYRNMDTFEYLAFTDLDEFIVPQGDLHTWHDVINNLNHTYPFLFKSMVAMTFKSTFYSEEFSRRTFSNEITMSVRTNRTKHFSFRRNKVIVRPDKIFELGIHHVSKPFYETDTQNIFKVPTEVAFIHHYRACVKEFGIHCQVRIEEFTVPMKYGQEIIDNYLKTLFDITP